MTRSSFASAFATLVLVLVAATVPSANAQTADETGELHAASQLQSPAEQITAIRAFLAKHPQSKLEPAAHFLLTRALLASKAPSKTIVDEAKLTLSLVPTDQPDLLRFRIETVVTVTDELAQRKDLLDVARELVKTVADTLPQDPDVIPVRHMLMLQDATVLEAQDKKDESLALVRKVLVEDPEDQTALVTLASRLKQRGQIDEAIDAYVTAEAAFYGEKMDGAALRELYSKRHGSLDGLDARLAAARTASLKRVALDQHAVDAVAPDWELKDMSGASVKLSDLKGQVVVMDFWATWCGPCREELPHIQELTGSYAGKAVRVVAINVEGANDVETWEKTVRSFVDKNKYTFTVVNDLDAKANVAYQVDALPTVFVIDKAGKIRYFNRGYNPAIKEILTMQIDSLAN